MASPAAERGTDILILDCPPQTAGTFALAAFRGHACKQADAERAAAPVPHLIGEGEGFAGAYLTLVDTAGSQRDMGKLQQHSTLPPRNANFAGEHRALRDQLVRPPLVPRVAGKGAERTDRLGQAPPVIVPLVYRVARLDQLARALRLVAPHRLDAQPVQEHGTTVLVPELREERQALLVQLCSRRIVARDVSAAPVRAQRVRTDLGRDAFGRGPSQQARKPSHALRRIMHDPELLD